MINLIKNLWITTKAGLSKILNRTRLQTNYPSCKFYPGMQSSNTLFGEYIVIFKEVILIDSEIGSHTYIQEKSVIVNAQIGKFCSIAPGVIVGPGIHKMDGVSTHPAFYLSDTPLVKTFSLNDTFEPGKRTVISNDVWVGQNVIIIDGVTIGNGAVIAAGAVVTKDVAPYSVVGGVPAKHIRFRFDAEVIDKLNNSEWWDRDESWLEKNSKLFSNVDQFIKEK